MARTFTYLFGIGATLLLVTLPLPHSRRSRHGRAGGDGDRRLRWRPWASWSSSTGCPCGSTKRRPCSARSWSAWPSTSAAPTPPPAYAVVLLLGRAGRLLLPQAGGRRHPPRARLRRLRDRPARQRRRRGPGSELGAGDGVAARRRHPDDGAAGPDGEDADRAGRGGPHRLADRAGEPPRARGPVRRRARALDPGRAAAVDRGARPRLVQGVQRSVRARRRRPRAGPARRGAEAGDADQRRRRAAGRRGVRRARAGDRRARGLSARRAAPSRGQGDLRPPAGEDDGELRRGQLPGAWHHRRRAPPLGRSSAVRGQGGGRDRSVLFQHAGAPAEDAEEAAIERTSPRLASLVSLAEAVDRRKGSPANSRQGGPLRRAAGPPPQPPRGGGRAGADRRAAARRGGGRRGGVDPQQAGRRSATRNGGSWSGTRRSAPASSGPPSSAGWASGS